MILPRPSVVFGELGNVPPVTAVNMGLNVEQSFAVLNDIFPDKAKSLLDDIVLLNQCEEQMDDWRERQLLHFLEITIASVFDFKRAYQERKISTVAWLARNFLELSAWIQYCNLSEENAKRFYDDAVRDMHGWALRLSMN
jgi:hypothetical protein